MFKMLFKTKPSDHVALRGAEQIAQTTFRGNKYNEDGNGCKYV